jgi:hypothetical protein
MNQGSSVSSSFSRFGAKFLPHAWPGFSWRNLKQLPVDDFQSRDGGNFMWDKIRPALEATGATQLFIGMFDEYDEATQIMPMSDLFPALPSSTIGGYVTNEGLPDWWYMQLAGEAKKIIAGQRQVGIYFIYLR